VDFAVCLQTLIRAPEKTVFGESAGGTPESADRDVCAVHAGGGFEQLEAV
jgi:hypothetical protein